MTAETLRSHRALRICDAVIRSCIVIVPFSVAVAPAAMNIFVGVLVAAYLAKQMLGFRRPCAVMGTAMVPLLVFFALTCLSLFHTIDLRDSLKGGILRLVLYAGVMCIIAEELVVERVRTLVLFSACAGIALVAIDGIWQVCTGHDFIRGYPSVINVGLARATASFKDPNSMGIYLSALAPIAFGAALFEKRPGARIASIALSVLATIGVALTYSRPTILAVYVVCVFFALAQKNRILLFCLIAALLTAPLLLPPSVKEWARQVEYHPLRFMCNDDRIAAYRTSLRMIAAHPVIGVGANTFMKNYKAYKESPEYRNVVTLDHMYAHNMYLQMAAEIGIPGLCVFFWFLIRIFAGAGALLRALPDDNARLVALSLTGCLIAFLVNGLTESSLYYSRVAVLFWFSAGVLFSLRHRLRAYGT